ncbi:MAG: sialate O-acetylesterase [Rikenellaceae bacterium]
MKLKPILLSAALLVALSGEAKVKLSSLWGDGMVLQQSEDVLFWGEAKAGAKLTITPSWSEKSYTTKVDRDGTWQIKIPTAAASCESHEIIFNDGQELKLSNVLLGEVWLCMGQSNMELNMKGNNSQPIEGAAEMVTLAKAERPIRMFKETLNPSPKELATCSGEWRLSTPENVLNYSATGYFFADYLNRALDVPVGLINVSWGGSTIEHWMSREWLSKVKEYDLSQQDAGEMSDNSRRDPLYGYNGMVVPLKGLTFKGILWYQGEANRSAYQDYGALLASFVGGLREFFDIGTFPFYYAQIAPLSYPTDGNNERMRVAMAEAESTIERCGMVTLTDVGEPMCIHPRYKRQVGQRFAYWALGDAYGIKSIEYRSPKYAGVKLMPAAKKIPVSLGVKFDYAPQGINYGNTINSENLEIAGEDRIFYPAESTIIRDSEYQLRVWSKKVPNPVAVRYAFKPYAKGDIFNNYGIPISTFRSDNW